MIKQFDRNNLKVLRADIDAALKAVGEKHGIVLTCGNASFLPTTATLKVECATKAADGQIVTREAEDFKRYAAMIGMQPSDLGKTFRQNGKTFKIEGYNSKARTMPIIAKDVASGRGYKFSIETVKVFLNATSK
jgi:hypothetical protein